jgi:SET family sugar efflux transporter-like MFS transporter
VEWGLSVKFSVNMLARFKTTARSMARQPNFMGLLGATLSLGMAFSFISPFISTWGTEAVKMSPSGFSLFMTCTSICAICAGTIMGRLSDTRLSRRHVLIVASLGGALGYVGYAFIRNPALLAVVGCLVLSLSAGAFSQLFAHVREEYRTTQGEPIEPGLMMSVVRVIFSFAWTMGPAVAAVIVVAFGFEGLYSAAALLWVLFLLGVIFFVPNRPRPKNVAHAKTDSVWHTFRRPDVVIVFTSFAVLAASQSINMMNLPLAIVHELGGKESDLGIVFGIGPLVEVPMMLWFGHLSTLGYQLKLIRWGFVLAILYFVGLSFATEPWHVYLLQIVSGVMVSITSNVAIVFFQDLMPSQPGLATALFSSAQSAGNLLGVLSFGFLVEGFGYRGVFYACTVLAIISFFMILRYRKSPVVEDTAP